MRALCVLALLLPVAGCQQPARPHYLVGKPYVLGGVWRYPKERFEGVETGLATVFRGHTPTADGESWSNGAMLAASPQLQLPAAVRVTNLDNGLQVVLRVNDRGPANPGRIIGVSPRVGYLLGAPGATAFPVRVRVLRRESEALAASLHAAGTVALRAAPAGAVTAQGLAPPPGARGSAGTSAPVAANAHAALFAGGPVLPLRPPEVLTRVHPQPGRLYVDCGGVGNPDDAERLAARLARFGAQAVPDYSYPLTAAFRARIGPEPSVAAADAMLGRVLQAGFAGARIVVK
ncbi:MAG: SPOR domain-containing protein [Rhodospirillales bacterium]|nr:SPOR domain-containing protein [Rhodospirillales bacterium]